MNERMDPAPTSSGKATASSSTGPPDAAAGGGMPTEFPAGLRVLLVDDDATCLKIIEMMLLKCHYDVTTCSCAVTALSMLRERKGWFDLVLSDVYMPDMDGFKLLEHIGLEMDLPVIMMSADDHKDVVMKGVTHGAVDYLIKPVRIEPLKNIWQHVVRKKRFELKELEHSGSFEENQRESERHKRAMEECDNATSGCGENLKNIKRKKEGKEDDEQDVDEQADPSQTKKPRVVWSSELHQQFVTAVNQLGIDKAVPKKILELMKVAGLTRENVASHLQKYRLYLRRLSVPQHQDRLDGPFTGAQDATFRSVGTVDGFDLQALAVSGQLLPQNLSALSSGSRRVTNTGLRMPVFDQMGFLNSGNASSTRSASVQQMNRGLGYFSGFSNSIESRQLGQSHQLVEPYGNMCSQVGEEISGLLNLPSPQTTRSSLPGAISNEQVNRSLIMHMSQQGQQFSLSQQHENFHGQPFPRGQIFNGIGGHDSRLSSKFGHQMSPNDISSHISGRTANIAQTPMSGNHISASYSSVPQALYANNIHDSCLTESAASHYPLASSIGDTPTTGNVEALSNTSSLKGVTDLSNCNIYSELRQNKTQDWKLKTVNISYQSGQNLAPKQNNADFGSSLVAHQDSIATVQDESSRNTCTVRKEILSVTTEIENEKIECVAQRNSTILVENSIRLKSESMPDIKHQEVLYDNIISNDLMDVGKQQQEGIEQDDPEFFDAYSLENIPM
ncbi:unnamed protein product [Musa acuminata subsp. burmannicoides]